MTDRQRAPWTPQEDQRLRTFVQLGQRVPAIAMALGRSQEAISVRCARLEINRKKNVQPSQE